MLHRKQESSVLAESYPLEPLQNDSDSASLTKSTRTKTSNRAVLAAWIPEIIASFFAVASLVAIILLLRVYNHRTLSELDLPLGLTLNGLIAIIATLNRAFLVVPLGSVLLQELWLHYSRPRKTDTGRPRPLKEMSVFDTASRGIWGCFILLWQFKGRRPLACITALVMILSLAVSTFTQQLVVFDATVPAPRHSHLAPGNLARSDKWITALGNPAEAAYSPPLNMSAAIQNGILTGNVAPVSPSCRSGNCTWPLTPTLAVCGGCTPSTYNRTCYAVDNEHNSCDPSTANKSSNCLTDRYCKYTFPTGAKTTMFNYEKYNGDDASEADPVGFTSLPTFSRLFNGSSNDRAFIANFNLIGAPYGSYLSQVKSISTHQCALWMCVQVLNSSVEATQSVQRVHSTIEEYTSSQDLYNGGWISDGVVDLFREEPQAPFRDSAYRATGFGLFTLQQYLNMSLTGTVNLDLEAQDFSSTLVQGIWNGTTDLNTWISNVATSMTNVIRTTSPAVDAQYDGTAYELGVRVRWAWLTLPALLVLVTIVLLGIAIARTLGSPVGVWKGDPLVFLLFDVDEEIKESGEGIFNQHGGVVEAVGRRGVMLEEKGDGGWKFKTY